MARRYAISDEIAGLTGPVPKNRRLSRGDNPGIQL